MGSNTLANQQPAGWPNKYLSAVVLWLLANQNADDVTRNTFNQVLLWRDANLVNSFSNDATTVTKGFPLHLV